MPVSRKRSSACEESAGRTDSSISAPSRRLEEIFRTSPSTRIQGGAPSTSSKSLPRRLTRPASQRSRRVVRVVSSEVEASGLASERATLSRSEESCMQTPAKNYSRGGDRIGDQKPEIFLAAPACELPRTSAMQARNNDCRVSPRQSRAYPSAWSVPQKGGAVYSLSKDIFARSASGSRICPREKSKPWMVTH